MIYNYIDQITIRITLIQLASTDYISVIIRCFQNSVPFVCNLDSYVDEQEFIRFRPRHGVAPIWIPPNSALALAML